jgi:hypothetical protein
MNKPAKPKAPTRAREISEMIEDFESQLNLLEEHPDRAFAKGEYRYCAEVATKLRLLVISSKQNKALLFKVAETFSMDMTIDVPPDPLPRADNPTGKMHFETFFDRYGYMYQSADGPQRVTHRQLIRIWSEKRGGAHSDWEEDVWLEPMLKFHDLLIEGLPVAQNVLKHLAGQTLHIGKQLVGFVRQITADDAAAAMQAGK